MNFDELVRLVKSDSLNISNQVFKDMSISKLKCSDIYISNCIFSNVSFEDNCFENIEIEQCTFENVIFKGKLKNVYIQCSNNSYKNCEILDVILEGYDEQSELCDEQFDSCYFSNISIGADLSFSGENMRNCKLDNISGKMNIIFECSFTNVSMNNISLDVAMMNNNFENTNLQYVRTEGMNSNNTFNSGFKDGKEI